jgi:acyl-coenzyme A thioesterase PaaI-like protein
VCVRVAAAAIHEGRSQRLWQVDLTRRDAGQLAARGEIHLQTMEG